MTTHARGALAALVLAAGLPAAAHAESKTAAAAGIVNSTDSLSAQDREMLAIANDFSRKVGEAIEKWISAKEVSEDQLFAFLYYPTPKTDPPKFTTAWDKLSDRDVQPIEEAVLQKSASINAAVLVDRDGYLPTHNLKFSQPMTGNTAVDLLNNRTKRIFNDRVGLAAARNKNPFLLQRYTRDSGEAFGDMSVPVFVKGQHFGAVRVTYRIADSK